MQVANGFRRYPQSERCCNIKVLSMRHPQDKLCLGASSARLALTFFSLVHPALFINIKHHLSHPIIFIVIIVIIILFLLPPSFALLLELLLFLIVVHLLKELVEFWHILWDLVQVIQQDPVSCLCSIRQKLIKIMHIFIVQRSVMKRLVLLPNFAHFHYLLLCVHIRADHH